MADPRRRGSLRGTGKWHAQTPYQRQQAQVEAVKLSDPTVLGWQRVDDTQVYILEDATLQPCDLGGWLVTITATIAGRMVEVKQQVCDALLKRFTDGLTCDDGQGWGG